MPRRKLWALCLTCAGGVVFQFLPGSCTDYLVGTTLASLDFCAVFNCTGGAFFDFCNPITLLVDCL